MILYVLLILIGVKLKLGLAYWILFSIGVLSDVIKALIRLFLDD